MNIGILDFIKEYNEKGIDAFKGRDIELPNIVEAKEFFDGFDEIEREKIKSELRRILRDIQEFELKLLEKKKRIKEKVKHMDNSKSACIAYLQQAQNLKAVKGKK